MNKKSDTKQGKQLLAQLEINMAEAEIFKSLQFKEILPYSKDNSRVSSIFLEDEKDNIVNIIEDCEKDIQGNYNINKIKLL